MIFWPYFIGQNLLLLIKKAHVGNINFIRIKRATDILFLSYRASNSLFILNCGRSFVWNTLSIHNFFFKQNQRISLLNQLLLISNFVLNIKVTGYCIHCLTIRNKSSQSFFFVQAHLKFSKYNNVFFLFFFIYFQLLILQN